MLEVTATMWPLGRQDRAYEMASLWLACQGQDQATGERSYKVALGKDKAFKGRPRDPQGPVWRRGFIAGHRAGPRGVWPLPAPCQSPPTNTEPPPKSPVASIIEFESRRICFAVN